MRVIAVVTARWNSTRLPGKMLADINGRPMLQVVIDQCYKSAVDEVVVATTHNSKEIIDYCESVSQLWVAGDEEDIIQRLYLASEKEDADLIIRAWGDSPCTNPQVINKLIRAWETSDNDYIYAPYEPKGVSAALITADRLAEDYRTIVNNDDKLWYHKYCIRQPYALALLLRYDLSGVNLSVDDEQSLELARSIIV